MNVYRLGTALLFLFFAPGCLFWSGPRELELLTDQRRESPFATKRFVKNPAEDEHALTDLRATMLHWTEEGPDGKPRWDGILAPHPETSTTGSSPASTTRPPRFDWSPTPTIPTASTS